MTTEGLVSVLVVDDHPVFRDALADGIRASGDLRLSGTASDDREAMVKVRADPPDIALLDVHLPTSGGLELVSTIASAGFATRCVMVSGDPDGPIVVEAVSRGAVGFLTKSASTGEIVTAVRAIARGATCFDADAQGLLAGVLREHGDFRTPAFTERELQFLQDTAEGYSTGVVAERRNYAPATVRGDLQSIYRKLGVHDRAAAVAEAYRRGLID
ncbi:response regulator [Paraconexibacter sp.]|uniref:response regulator n=1 Tax=Paraconexibacter sp. TaxID=2949640 RepID=UPI0035622923